MRIRTYESLPTYLYSIYIVGFFDDDDGDGDSCSGRASGRAAAAKNRFFACSKLIETLMDEIIYC